MEGRVAEWVARLKRNDPTLTGLNLYGIRWCGAAALYQLMSAQEIGLEMLRCAHSRCHPHELHPHTPQSRRLVLVWSGGAVPAADVRAGNQIGDAVAQHIADALRTNSVPTELYLVRKR